MFKKKDLVACGHPTVAQVASQILKKGGNAYDAIVAAGFISPIAEPTLTSLGGGGFLLSHQQNGKCTLYDFFVNVPGKGKAKSQSVSPLKAVRVKFPSSAQVFHTGRGSIAVPGVLKGLLHVHRKLGSLPLKEILTPAVNAATQGVILNEVQAYTLELLYPILTQTSKGRQLFAPRGRPLQKGARFANKDYADFLSEIERGAEKEFYSSLACIPKSLVTSEDLIRYQVLERKPLFKKIKDIYLITNPLPSIGGEQIHWLLSNLYKNKKNNLSLELSHFAQLMKTLQEIQSRKSKKKGFYRGTTHISISDRYGNSASMTSSNGEGSGYFASHTGVMLNNMLGEEDLVPNYSSLPQAGVRLQSMMAPCVILDLQKKPLLVTGSGGSNRIPTAITQVLNYFLQWKYSLKKSISAPRIHWDSKKLQIEFGFSKKSLNDLIHLTQNQFHPVTLWKEKNLYFGGVHSVAPRQGKACGDLRRGGSSRVISP